MGSRHNRRRTRSRPRNRNVDKAMIAAPLPHSIHSFNSRPATHWHQQYNAWQDRIRVHQQCRSHNQQPQRRSSEDHYLRFFGGEPADGMTLCAPMLQVVMDLFEGRTDYVDP